MKILQTGDWHIGKLVHGVHMTSDQRVILSQLVALIETEKPQVLLITGDLYDRSIPPVEAVELLDEMLSEIILKHRITVIVIAGNHDSPDRVGFASKMLMNQGLFIAGHISKTIEPIVVEDEYGEVNFYPIPFSEPAVVRELYGDDAIRDHDSAMNAIMDRIQKNIDKSKRNICIAHAYMMGAIPLETSDSERPLSIGGSEMVNVDYFEPFHYVAVGHLHRPQKVKHEHIRYAGSLLKYSFSEATQKKSVTLMEMDGLGKVDIRLIELKPIRDLRVIKGTLEDLIHKDVYTTENTDDYIMAILTDRGELIDAMSKLRAVYPNILRLEKEGFDREAGEGLTKTSSDFVSKSPVDLFAEFYEEMSGEVFVDEKRCVIADLVDAIEQKRRTS